MKDKLFLLALSLRGSFKKVWLQLFRVILNVDARQMENQGITFLSLFYLHFPHCGGVPIILIPYCVQVQRMGSEVGQMTFWNCCQCGDYSKQRVLLTHFGIFTCFGTSHSGCYVRMLFSSILICG